MDTYKYKISIIVPIYNASIGLNECINSILNQSFNDFEVLLINDGSLDDSLHKCTVFEKRDSRVKVFNKSNGGVSSARNVGLKNSIGKYIFHVDADDLLLENALLNLYKRAEEDDLDIVIGDYIIQHKTKDEPIKHIEISDSLNLLTEFLNGTYHNALWNKLLKRELYYGLQFVDGVDYMEDKLILTIILLKKPKIGFIKSFVYRYIQREGSYSNNISEKSLESVVFVVAEIGKLLKNRPRFIDDIVYLKLRCKLLILLNTKKTNRFVSKTFDEVNKGILKSKKLQLKYKILLYFESRNISILTKVYRLIKK